MATLKTSLEANYDTTRTPHGRTKQLIGARATALPKKQHNLEKAESAASGACEHFVEKHQEQVLILRLEDFANI